MVESPFGGISVILLGDFGQLPPVGDRALYVSGNGSIISDHGMLQYHKPLAASHSKLLDQWQDDHSVVA